MKNTLLVTSSPRGEMSHSRKVATDLVNEIGGHVTTRELWRDAPAPIDPSFIQASFTPEADRTVDQRAALAYSDQLIDELRHADVVVIAAGLINFGMPSALKNWIDQISRAGVTFRYGESGPEGLLTGKRLVLVLSYGGVYSSGPRAGMDHLEPPLRTLMTFLGFTDIETVRVEGAAMGPEVLEKALADADVRVHELSTAYAA